VVLDSDKTAVATFIDPTGPIGIESDLSDLEVAPGSPVAFEILASGERPIAYRWFRDNVLLGESSIPAWVIEAASPEDTGAYHVELSNAHTNNLKSSIAHLTVSKSVPPTVQNLFANPEVLGEGWVLVSGFGPLYLSSYPWIHIPDFGWVRIRPTGFERFWFYREGVGWLWTGSALWPYLWFPQEEDWVFFDDNSQSLYHFATGDWETLP
jgi:hypothetical protein